MSTDRQFTEDIEIDDEPVELNIAHSLFFDTYYNSLTDIESSNRQLLDAQEQLRWYTSQLDEVDRLADEARIPNSSTISSAALPHIIRLNRISDEKDFKSFFKKINQLEETEIRQSKEANDIKGSNKLRIDTLNLQLISIENEINRREEIINTDKSRSIKRTRILSSIIILFLIILLAFGFPNFASLLILPGVIVTLILTLIKTGML
jgi:hypothetical protein